MDGFFVSPVCSVQTLGDLACIPYLFRSTKSYTPDRVLQGKNNPRNTTSRACLLIEGSTLRRGTCSVHFPENPDLHISIWIVTVEVRTDETTGG